jgi:serine/threonine-protein kinase SRPK3
MLADRISTIEEMESYIGPALVYWLNALDDTVRKRINGEMRIRTIALDRYLRLAYDQDDAALFEEDE